MLDCRTYRPDNKSSRHDDEVAQNGAKWVRCLQMQWKSQMFNSLDPISVISFLLAFWWACDANRVKEEAAVWLLHFSMSCPAAAALNSRIALRSKSHRRQKMGTIMTILQSSHVPYRNVRG